MKHRKIFILSGHSNHRNDFGYVNELYAEGDLTVNFRHLIIKQLKNFDVRPYNVNNSIVSKIHAWFSNKLSFHKNIILDLHFDNSMNSIVSGVTTLIPRNSSETERLLAYQLSDSVHKALFIDKRNNHKGLEGVKIGLNTHHGRQSCMQLTGENVLLETCFMTNKHDMQMFQDNKVLAAYYIAQILVKYSIIDDEAKLYKVVAGDTIHRISYQHNVSIKTIKKLNNLSSDAILIGQILKLKKY